MYEVRNTGRPPFIRHFSGTHKTHSLRDTENWFTSLKRTTHQVQYIWMWASSLAHTPFQHLGCHRRNCIFDSCIKFDHTTKFWTEYLVFYIAPKEEVNGVYIRWTRGHRNWPVPPNPPVWKSFIQWFSHCQTPVWKDTILLKVKVWLKMSHLRDCKQITTGWAEKLHKLSPQFSVN